jgi:type II secretory pathway component PulF
MLSIGADERAVLVFDDLASALDAGLPPESLGGVVADGDRVLLGIAKRRGVRLTPTEETVLVNAWRSGKAGDALRCRARHRQQHAEFKRTLWSKVAYPLLLFVMLFVASLATSALLGAGMAITLAVLYTVLGAAGWLTWRAVRRGSAESWPVVGRLVKDSRELPYLETLHALYGAGIAIVDAHRSAVDAVRMQGLRARLEIAQSHLASGESLRESLQQAAALDPETRALLSIGEQAGQLEDALARALQRRQAVATQTLGLAARRAGQIAYSAAVIGVVVSVFRFYSTYLGGMRL